MAPKTGPHDAPGFLYFIFRSRRKSIALSVTKDALVEVRAPLFASGAAIHAFVLQKQAWVRSALHRRQEVLRAQADYVLTNGSLLRLRGGLFPLVLEAGSTARFENGRFYAPQGLPEAELRTALAAVYRRLALDYIPARTEALASAMRVQPISVQIGSAKSRWGSCNAAHALRFSYRLMLLDDALVDYVIVHELAHVREMNHSPAFWRIVNNTLVNTPALRLGLREAARTLEQEGWL